MKDTAIFLFTKSPAPNVAKTRIARDLGKTKALSLHKAFLKDTLKTLNRIKNTDKYIACTKEGSEFFDQYTTFQKFFVVNNTYYLDNISSYIGNLTFAIKYLFSLEYSNVLAVHADCPDVPLKYIEEAVEKLNNHDFVIGPTMDGGFYLFGLKKFIPGLFYSVRHGTNFALEDIKDFCLKSNVKSFEAKKWYDLDTVEDLKIFLKRNNHASSTQKILRKFNLEV